jgi:tRNA-(ms[2]io[6]A)-hydroxylase
MLHLEGKTDRAWLERALGSLDAILLDHAHLEKKAAAQALNLIFRYPDRPAFAAPLSALAREELAHFELVLEHLGRRGLAFGPQRPAPYAGRLRSIVRAQEPGRLLDSLLCSAVIEARSCERMTLLAGAVTDPELRALYDGLLAAEARHHRIYLDLAEQYFDREEVSARLVEIAQHEAKVLEEAPLEPRFHN